MRGSSRLADFVAGAGRRGLPGRRSGGPSVRRPVPRRLRAAMPLRGQCRSTAPQQCRGALLRQSVRRHRSCLSRRGAHPRAPPPAPAARPTASPEAYDHFLRGNHFLLARTGGSIARAIEQYEAATRVDPQFADAFARTAFGYGLFLEWRWPSPTAPPDSLLARAVAAADRALALQPTSSDAWVASGHLP